MKLIVSYIVICNQSSSQLTFVLCVVVGPRYLWKYYINVCFSSEHPSILIMLGCNLLRHIHSTTRLSCGAPTIEKRKILRINNTHSLFNVAKALKN